MPSYRHRVYMCPSKNGQPGWIVDFPLWWPRSAFFEKYGHRQMDTNNPWYVDYGLLLTFGEAMAWDRQARAAFAADPRSQQPDVIEAMQRWESMLGDASWVIVESYEWESGLD